MQIESPSQLRELIHHRSLVHRVIIITDTSGQYQQYASLFTHPADFENTATLNPQLVQDSITVLKNTDIHTVHTQTTLPLVSVIGRHLVTEIIASPTGFTIKSYDNPPVQSQMGIE